MVVHRIAVAIWTLCAASLATAQTIDFQREIRPILSDNCFFCHGPDSDRAWPACASTVPKPLSPRGPAAPGRPRKFRRQPALSAHHHPPTRTYACLPPPRAKQSHARADRTHSSAGSTGAPWKEQWSFQPPVKPAPLSVKGAATDPLGRTTPSTASFSRASKRKASRPPRPPTPAPSSAASRSPHRPASQTRRSRSLPRRHRARRL